MLRVNIHLVNCSKFMMWAIETPICRTEHITSLVSEVSPLFLDIGRYFNLLICLDLKRGNCLGNTFLPTKLNWSFSWTQKINQYRKKMKSPYTGQQHVFWKFHADNSWNDGMKISQKFSKKIIQVSVANQVYFKKECRILGWLSGRA